MAKNSDDKNQPSRTSFFIDADEKADASKRAKAEYGVGFAGLVRGLIKAFNRGKFDDLFAEDPELVEIIKAEKKRAPGAGRPAKLQPSNDSSDKKGAD